MAKKSVAVLYEQRTAAKARHNLPNHPTIPVAAPLTTTFVLCVLFACPAVESFSTPADGSGFARHLCQASSVHHNRATHTSFIGRPAESSCWAFRRSRSSLYIGRQDQPDPGSNRKGLSFPSLFARGTTAPESLDTRAAASPNQLQAKERQRGDDEDLFSFWDARLDWSGGDNEAVGIEEEKGMGDLVSFLKSEGSEEFAPAAASKEMNDGAISKAVLPIGAITMLVIAAIAAPSTGIDMSLPNFSEALAAGEHFFSELFADPNAALQEVVNSVQSMGSQGFLYFGLVYTIAEILAVPAIPLTASAGYLFGVKEGTAVVLVSASIAAAISFLIGRTLLRSYVEKALEDYPKFKKIDRAIGEEGFKLMFLLRLSPIFPFALSNYLYGASSVKFWPFFLGTLLGFAPGTFAYVYTGEIGKALTIDSASAEPWYVYAGGIVLLAGFLKVVADVATGIIDNLDDDE